VGGPTEWKSELAVSTLLSEHPRVARFFLVPHTKMGEKLPTDHKIYQMVAKYTKCQQNITTFCTPRPSKIYRNGDFWFGNTYTVWQPCVHLGSLLLSTHVSILSSKHSPHINASITAYATFVSMSF
jgi:hypothetical protein